MKINIKTAALSVSALLIIISAVFLLSGYSLFTKKTFVIWTDQPAIITYIENFNTSQKSVKAELVYKKNPAEEIRKTKTHPDLVISSSLNSVRVIENFSKTDSLFSKNKISSDIFYSKLLKQGKIEDKQFLIPVSFNLPALMFRKGEVSYNISNFVLNEQNLIDISKDFNTENSSLIAFSPRWNRDFLVHIASLYGASFREKGSGRLSYNIDNIEKSLSFVRNFIETTNKGIDNDIAFEDKYLYKPAENLIDEGKIFFSFTDLRNFYATSQKERVNLNFRWTSKDDYIMANPDIIYAGIPRHAENKRGAMNFMEWFFSHETQQKLMESAKEKRTRSFGICMGFSSIKSVNEQIFPKHYPLLVGHIPPEDILEFPEPRPLEWEQIKEEAVLDWLYRESANSSTETSLDEAVNNWYKLNPEY